MKKLLPSVLVLAGAAAACQHNAPATALTTNAQQASPATTSPAATPDSTAAVLALLRQVDLAAAWTTPKNMAMDGFYGPDNYRISFHIDSVRRDAAQPNVYHFEGRDRYKKAITPFTGTLTITRLAPLRDTVGLWQSSTNRAYSAFASFVLREDPTAEGAGHCTGRAALDFVVNPQHQATEASFDGIDLGEENPTQGCGLVFKGVWQDNRTGRQQSVSWANFYGVIVPDVLREMGLGSRGDEVNPKLARYGWNTIMENDEWWTDSPKPSLSL